MNSIKFIFIFLICLPRVSYSYLSILDSGEPIKPDTYHLGFAPQFASSSYSGANAVFHMRKGLVEGRDLSIQVGTGAVDMWGTIATRWIPIPDIDNQPAIGLRFDVTLAQYKGTSVGTLRGAPFASKRYRTDVGNIEPYAYVPLGFEIADGNYQNVSNLVLGSQLMLEDLRPIYFYGELGFNMKNSVSYFTVGIFSTFER